VGVLASGVATLPSAMNAIRAARELRATLGEEGVFVRVGIHVGDVDNRGDDISGLTMNVAARIMHLAAPGKLLVSGGVRLAVAGTPVHFETRGQYQLKGVPDTWQLFEVTYG
jgi:class 3 adenylate cyclase